MRVWPLTAAEQLRIALIGILLADVRLNGTSAAESGLSAAVAGHLGVPVIMISGDNHVIDEARGLLGSVEGRP